ncbi:MAG: hypothetical protein R3321_01275 [Nitrososphaeraceae archaeon]|nr:hypothetical protein [Nitrososphaeraceae archaeon]
MNIRNNYGKKVTIYVKSNQHAVFKRVLEHLKKLKSKHLIESESEFLIKMIIDRYREMDWEGLIPDTQSSLENYDKLGREQTKITEYTKIPRLNEFVSNGICGTKSIRDVYEYHLEDVGGEKELARIVSGAEMIVREMKYDPKLRERLNEIRTVR